VDKKTLQRNNRLGIINQNNTSIHLAAIISYAVISQLNHANWIALTIGALIFLTAYLTAAPMIGALNKTDIQNLKEMIKGLGPLTPLFTTPLSH
jgi:hypothetical protein